MSGPTAAQLGLLSCHHCTKLTPVADARPAHHPRCERCHSKLHLRKPESVSRTWAFILAAAILYIPANVYPVMTVIYFGSGAPDTILSGVIHLMQAGEWPIAVLVFVASVMVPLLKLLGLAWLAFTVQRSSRWRPKDRTALYRVIEVVGRWSMLDIFMISILVALVQLGAVATIVPGTGATAFAAVVVLTMFAAESFDPRLIWDRAEPAGSP